MKGKWRRAWRLDVRLMTLICLSVIPLNLLAIIGSHAALTESRERIVITCRNEFESLADDLNHRTSRLNDWYMEFLTTNLPAITTPGAFSAVISITLVNRIGEALSLFDFPGFVMLSETRDGGSAYLRARGGLYDGALLLDLKAALLAGGLASRIQPLAGRQVFYRALAYKNYTLHVGVDMGSFLRQTDISGLLDGFPLCVSDGHASLTLAGEGNATPAHSLPLLLPFGGAPDGTLTLSIGEAAVEMQAERAYQLLLIVAWLGLAALAVLFLVIRRQVIRPLRALRQSFASFRIEPEYRITAPAKLEDFEVLSASFNEMAQTVSQMHEKEIQLYETQLVNLKLQVNPHLLLNSLTTVYSLAQTKDFELIQRYALDLIEYFRYCLRETDTLVPLQGELRFVERYMSIQNTRYPGRYRYGCEVGAEAERAVVPPLLIQSFVENAAKYARAGSEATEIALWIRREGDDLCVRVSDNGNNAKNPLLQGVNISSLPTTTMRMAITVVGILPILMAYPFFQNTSRAASPSARSRGERVERPGIVNRSCTCFERKGLPHPCAAAPAACGILFPDQRRVP